MTKIRITILLLALGIGLPAALLVNSAIESRALENAYRHEAVAERVFDEMERSLSDFLLREEPRPPSDYDAGLSATGAQTPASVAFLSADEPFIVGWWSFDSVGQVRLLAPHAEDSTRVRSAVGTALGQRDRVRETHDPISPALAKVDESEPAPGRTQSTGRVQVGKKDVDDSLEDANLQSSAYEILQNLNRGQSIRSERKSKTLEAISPQYAAAAPAPTSGSDMAAAMKPTLSRFDDAREGSISSFAYAAEQEPRESLDDETREVNDEDPARLRLAVLDAGAVTTVDPLIGRLTEAGDIVLSRSVWRGGRVDRQGLVLDRDALVMWMRERVLFETGLAEHAHLDFATPELPPRADTEYRYLHRFAEPFDGLVARLDLQPLAGLGSARPIYALALLLALVGAIGLFAVDRMTQVVVAYAQRRSNFVAAVSHELKTPLTSIRMYGEMLRDGLVASEEKRAEYYKTITGESERLSRLIDNVLEFSRLEQNRRELDLVVGGLAETIRDVAERLRAHAERDGFTLRLELSESLPCVRYDRDAITQILFNLVDNAQKYARSASRREIAVQLTADNDHVALRVRDYGPGVSRKQLERIFEPFYRVGDELTRTTDGTGIGLAIVKELVEKSGGRVRAEIPDDGGFAVAIEFDVEPAHDRQAARWRTSA